MVRAATLGLVALAACAAEEARPPAPARVSVATPGAMRAMAVVDDWIALAWEPEGVVLAYGARDGEPLGMLRVGSGPRSVAATDGGLVVGIANERSIARVALRGGVLVATGSIALAAPPFHVAARGERIAAVTGIEEPDRAIEVPGRAPRPLPGAVSTLFTEAGAIVALVPSRSEVVFEDGTALPVCAGAFSGRASGGAIVLACRSGGVDVLRGTARVHLDAGKTTYDVALADLDGDGLDDIAAVDLGGPAVHVLRGVPGGFAPAEALEISRGPIAIEALAGGGGLAVLAFEARKLELILDAGDRHGGEG